MTNKLGVPPLTYDEWMAVLRERAELGTSAQVPRRHYGPGPHKNGTSQAVHGPSFGDTVHPVTGRRPTTGYQVGQPTGSMIMPREDYDRDAGKSAGVAFVERNREVFRSNPDVYMGVWLDKDKGEIDLDISHNIQSRSEAIRQAQEWDQQAIWDNVKGQAINVGGTGAREHAESRHQATGRLGRDDRGREEGLDGASAGRGSLRGVDPDVSEALERFYRHLAGQHDQKTHGHGGGGVDAGAAGGGKRIGVHTGNRLGEVAPQNVEKYNAKLVDNATSMSALPQGLQDKITAKFATLGGTPESAEANIESMLTRARGQSANPDEPEGIDWYDEAHEGAVNITKVAPAMSASQGAGMIAAMSPQQPWGDNLVGATYVAQMMHEDPIIPVELLERTMITKADMPGIGKKITGSALDFAMLESAGRTFEGKTSTPPSRSELGKMRLSDLDPGVAGAVIKAMGQSGYNTPTGGKLSAVDDVTGEVGAVGWTCGVAMVSKAVRIGRGEDPDIVLRGHKVRSFYNNVDDPHNAFDDVTVDVHSFSTAMGKKYASGSDEYGTFSGGPPVDQSLGVKGLYPIVADAYRAVGARQKPPLSARQVQAITWIQWRKDHPDKQRAGQLKKQAAAAAAAKKEAGGG